MFKKSLLLLLSGAGLSASAQQNDVVSFYRNGADRVLGGISQYPVQSGILYNRAFPFSEAVRNPLEPNNPETFAQSVHEMEMALISPGQSVNPKKLCRNYRQKSLYGDLHLLAYFTLVDEVDTGRIRDSSLVLNNGFFQFFPGPGKETPFRSTEKTAAVLMAAGPLETGKSYQVQFPANIAIGKQFLLPLAARFRVAEGNWQDIPQGGSISLIFNQEGSHEIEIEISWSGGIVRNYRQNLLAQITGDCTHPEFFRRSDDCPDWQSHPDYSPSWPPSPVSASIPFGGINGKGEVWHYLRSGNNSQPSSPQLSNPIIFVEGIDFGDERNGRVIYGKYLSYLPTSGGVSSVHLGAQLRNQGNDLIILNFPDGRNPANVAAGTANQGIDGGTDYIERNAMVLVKLIQQVNSQLQPGSRKVTVVGSSMGGLIARYALAYMEKNAASTGTHHCGLFISQDAPHLGANIPVGLQQLIRNLAKINLSQAEEAWDGLLTPAASELLINHAAHGENTLHHDSRSQFLQNMEQNGLPGSKGWPKDPGLRMASISNGTASGYRINGSANPVSPVAGGNEMLSFSLRINNPSIIGFAMAIFDDGYSLGPNAFLLTGKMEWKSRYTPEQNASANTFSFGFGTSLLNQSLDLYTENCNWQAWDEGISTDASPGGRSNTTDILADQVRIGMQHSNYLLRLHLEKADQFHCFIPVKSALAFRWNSSGLKNLGENLGERNLVCTGETPFHDYLCSNGNDDHIRLTNEAVNFVYKQLNYTPPSGGVNYPAEINGPRAVSSGSQSDFSALYQGSLQFRTSWSISATEGISASVINPFSTSCKVSVSSGQGQEDGFFMLRLTTEVKSLNGDWICAGSKTMKVNVRKIQYAGSIQVSCQTNLPKGCYFKLLSATPDYSTLSNGVTGNGFEWQVSRYADTDFGNSCWNNSLTINPSGLGFAGEQKAYINLLYNASGGIGNVFGYYARIRNKMRIPNPDFGAPGEPQFLDLYGPWKLRQLQTEVLSGNCPVCPGALIVNPAEPVKHTDDEVLVQIPGDVPLPAQLVLTDGSGIKIREYRVNHTSQLLSLESLDPGMYRILLESGEIRLITEFWFRESTQEQLLASPSLLIKDLHKEVRIRILDEHYLEEGSGSYRAILKNQGNGEIISWSGSLQEFGQDIHHLENGNYLLELNNGLRTVSCSFEILPSIENQIFLYPNPASLEILTGISGTEPQENAFIRILNPQGNVVKLSAWDEKQTLLQINNLDPGLYLLQFINGNNPRNIWFRKE